MLLPLALCPYVLYYALGGAILSSSVMGGNKAGLSGPNDAWHGAAPWALIYGFPCQRRLAPLGSPMAVTRQASLQCSSQAWDTHEGMHTLSTVGVLITEMWQRTHMAAKYAEIKYISSKKFFQLCNIHSCYTVWEEAGWYIWSVISKELTSSQATSRPLPGTHCLFYQSLRCGRGCEIWRESEEEMW